MDCQRAKERRLQSVEKSAKMEIIKFLIFNLKFLINLK